MVVALRIFTSSGMAQFPGTALQAQVTEYLSPGADFCLLQLSGLLRSKYLLCSQSCPQCHHRQQQHRHARHWLHLSSRCDIGRFDRSKSENGETRGHFRKGH